MLPKQCPFIANHKYKIIQAFAGVNIGDIVIFKRLANNIHEMLLVYFFISELTSEEKRWNVRIEEWETILSEWDKYFEPC